MNLDLIFKDEPSRWGLRGDPYLWNEIKRAACRHGVFDNSEQFAIYLQSAIEQIVGCELTDGVFPYVDQFDHGGMSGGRIDAGFWLKTLLPLLKTRFDQLHQEHSRYI